MSNVKQIIVMRKDLNMRKGKIAAQAAHASMKVILDEMEWEGYSAGRVGTLLAGGPLNEWLRGSFTKICVSVDSEQELLELLQKAKDAGILTALITDAGATEFKGVPTNTCIAIGPDYSEVIDPITGHLKLL